MSELVLDPVLVRAAVDAGVAIEDLAVWKQIAAWSADIQARMAELDARLDAFTQERTALTAEGERCVQALFTLTAIFDQLGSE